MDEKAKKLEDKQAEQVAGGRGGHALVRPCNGPCPYTDRLCRDCQYMLTFLCACDYIASPSQKIGL